MSLVSFTTFFLTYILLVFLFSQSSGFRIDPCLFTICLESGLIYIIYIISFINYNAIVVIMCFVLFFAVRKREDQFYLPFNFTSSENKQTASCNETSPGKIRQEDAMKNVVVLKQLSDHTVINSHTTVSLWSRWRHLLYTETFISVQMMIGKPEREAINGSVCVHVFFLFLDGHFLPLPRQNTYLPNVWAIREKDWSFLTMKASLCLVCQVRQICIWSAWEGSWQSFVCDNSRQLCQVLSPCLLYMAGRSRRLQKASVDFIVVLSECVWCLVDTFLVRSISYRLFITGYCALHWSIHLAI